MNNQISENNHITPNLITPKVLMSFPAYFEFKSVVLVLVMWYWCFGGGSICTLVITVVMVWSGFGGFCSCCNVSFEYFVAILK